MTLATLHAMLGKGEVYPELEVVLVDNGSSPAVLDVLRERAAQDGRIVLIENGENLGFARGNNRGIAAATGEYVLLLNNDTFLAPGALLAMVRGDEVDLAFASLTVGGEQEGMATQRLVTEPLVVLLAPDHRLAGRARLRFAELRD